LNLLFAPIAGDSSMSYNVHIDCNGQILAQVITNHEAMICVSMGEVDGGTIDEKWDMVNQREISGQPPKTEEAQHQNNE